MFTSISRFCGAEVVTTFVSICQASSDSSHPRGTRGLSTHAPPRGGFNVIYTRPGRGTRAPRGTPGYARNNERMNKPESDRPRTVVPCTRSGFGARPFGTGDRESRNRTRRAGRGHAPDRADSGRLREAASRACGDGVTPHCTYGGTARRARRDLLCAPCGLFDIPTASVVPPHGSTHAMTLRTARGARARRPHARETDRRDGCGAFRRSP